MEKFLLVKDLHLSQLSLWSLMVDLSYKCFLILVGKHSVAFTTVYVQRVGSYYQRGKNAEFFRFSVQYDIPS